MGNSVVVVDMVGLTYTSKAEELSLWLDSVDSEVPDGETFQILVYPIV